MCTMMQMQGSQMMDVGGGQAAAAAFWGARHASWPTAHSHTSVTGMGATPGTPTSHHDPKMAEKLVTELQVRICHCCYRPIISTMVMHNGTRNRLQSLDDSLENVLFV